MKWSEFVREMVEPFYAFGKIFFIPKAEPPKVPKREVFAENVKRAAITNQATHSLS